MGEARGQLADILTDKQQVALRNRMQILATGPTTAPKAPPTVPGSTVDDPMARPGPAKRPAEMTPAPQAVTTEPAVVTTGAVGSVAPAFSLDRVKSGIATLTVLKNKVVVLEFGSYSAPPFRYRSAAMDALAKEVGSRAEFITIYTAEAYPAGEWNIDRNKTDNVSIPRHADAAARLAAAEKARTALRPNRTLAVDTMDNATARAYRAGAHSAFVIGRDGTIVARQQWCDPDGLKRHIDAAVQQKIEK
jgi:hypothetical protein